MHYSSPPIILIIDDTTDNLFLAASILKDIYAVRVANSGHRGLQLANTTPLPDLILLDIMMPLMDGYEVCRQLKANPTTREIPVVFLTAISDGDNEYKWFELGAVDYITKPIHPSVLQARVRTQLTLYHNRRILEQQVAERTSDLEQSRRQVIIRLGRAAEFKDNETGNHVIRMSQYVRLIAQAKGMDERFIELLCSASPMHDIGKIGIPDSILRKPGKLEPDELKIMREHPVIGAEIIGHHKDELLQMAHIVAIAHHEKWDGSGYPYHIKGEEIPLAARIVAIADVFDALTSVRPYKAAWPVERAVRTILDDAGKHFDPNWMKPFQDALPEMLLIQEKYSDG